MIFVEVYLLIASLCIAGAAYQIANVVEFHAALFALVSLSVWVAANMLMFLWFAFEEIVLQ